MRTLVDAVLQIAQSAATDKLAPAVLIAGCTSNAGKSVLVTALCAALRHRGLRVAPFKAQNMSNNAAVTPDGGEIGRAQYVQAKASGITPSTFLNPILLKPRSDQRSQLIVHGKPVADVGARDYFPDRRGLRKLCVEDLQQLRREYDIVVCEGAGSPAEVNLRATDISNIGLAAAASIPVIVVGDIDRGGVLAHFVGTFELLDDADRELLQGFIVNKFRGDESLLEPGLVTVEERTGVPVLGVVPFVQGYWYGAEDSLQAVEGQYVGSPQPAAGTTRLCIAAIRYPRLANATDLEALSYEPGVDVYWARHPGEVETADAVVLPGSKDTLADLQWLRSRGLDKAVTQAAAAGKMVMGLCGGYQMLGCFLVDEAESVSGLGLLPVKICYASTKTVAEFSGSLVSLPAGGIQGSAQAVTYPVHGYEIHEGCSTYLDGEPLLNYTDGTPEGCHVGTVWGTHCHGFFHNDAVRQLWLRHVAQSVGKTGFVLHEPPISATAVEEAQLDLLRCAIDHCPAR